MRIEACRPRADALGYNLPPLRGWYSSGSERKNIAQGSPPSNTRFRILGLLILIVLVTGCTRRSPTVAMPPAVVPVVAPLPALRTELDDVFDNSLSRRATWAALIQSLDSGETLFSLNAERLMMPASNMKILTAAAAGERLGWDFRFTTKIIGAGSLENGVLRGDLVIVGNGDPTITARRQGENPAILEQWSQQLWDRGLRSIDGRIIGDDNAFDDEGLGAGWAWDYLAYGYAAPTGALQSNENIVELSIQSGAAAGEPVRVTAAPAGHGLKLINRLKTGAPESSTSIELRRLPGSHALELIGSVKAGEPPLTRTASVDNPTEFFVGALREALLARGITVHGPALDIDSVDESPSGQGQELLVHQSPPLGEILTTMMKVSQNAYADTLLKTLGATTGIGSAAAGRLVVRQILESWGIGPDSYVMYDGSGLSRYNYVTADTVVRILRKMAEDPKHATFASTLPTAGRDGTLSRRMRGTLAEANASAKTGSISNVRTLSGYVTTSDGERLVFSILANHFNVPQDEVDAVTDRIIDRLASFKRR